MHSLSLILAGILLATGCSAIIFDRPCRGVTMVMDFDLRNYARNWFEVRRYQTSPQWNGDCSTFNYALNNEEEPEYLQVNHRFAFRNNGTIVNRRGTLSQRSDHHNHPSHVGHLMMTFDDAPDAHINYCLVATDYQNFAVVWSCENLEGGRSNEDAWVLSKETTLNTAFDAAVQAAIDAELDESIMTSTYQGSSCQAIGAH